MSNNENFNNKNFNNPENFEDTHLYYNVEIYSKSGGLTKAIYKDYAFKELIKKPELWHLSVARFTIPSFNIPLFIFRIQEGIGQTDINKGIYSVTLEYAGQKKQEFLQYIRADFGTNILPSPPSLNGGVQDLDSSYYYVFYYKVFLEMINNAFALAYSKLTGPPGGSSAPYIVFDPVTELFSLIVDFAYITSSPPINIFMNVDLYRFFNSFRQEFYGFNQPFGLENKIIVNSGINDENAYHPPSEVLNQTIVTTVINPTTNQIDTTTNYSYYKINQEFSTLGYWYHLTSIVFKTSLIPCRDEYIQNIVDGVNLTNGTDSIETILTDFEPAFNNSRDSRGKLQYIPSIYRLIDLKNFSPLKRIDLEILWKDDKGRLRLLELSPNNIITVKLMFRRKTLIH